MSGTGLSIDVGTSGTKVVYVDASGVAAWSETWRCHITDPDGLEDLVACVIDLLRTGVAGLPGPDYVVICGILSFMVLGSDGSFRDRWHWWDGTTEDRWSPILDELQSRTGRPPASEPYVARLVGRTWAAGDRLMSLKDYILWRVTGRWVTDPVSASYTGLFGVRDGDWLRVLPRPALPPVIAADAPVGRLDACFPWAAGATVLAGSLDGTTAMVGFGLHAGDVGLVLGTTAVMFRRLTPDSCVAPVGAVVNCDPFASGRPTSVYAGGPTCVFATALDALGVCAADISAEPTHLLCVPWFWPRRAPAWRPPHWAVVGGRAELSKETYAGAWVEGVALGLADFRDALEQCAPEQGTPRTVMGGGPATRPVAQVFANVWGRQIELADAGSYRGNWQIMQRHTDWTATSHPIMVSPVPEHSEYYRRLYDVYRDAEEHAQRWARRLTEAGG